MKKNKAIILGLIFVLSGIFFWQTTNRFLYPSKALSVEMGLSFEQEQINTTLSSQSEIPLNVLFTTMPDTQITGANIVIRYNPKLLEYFEKDEAFADSSCVNVGFQFTKRVRVLNDTDTGTVVITRIVDPVVTDLPSGRMCWGTILFKAKTTGESYVSFETTDVSGYEIVGPKSVYAPRFNEPRSVKIKADE